MRIGKYTFSWVFLEEAILPKYKGSTFRGVLGRALKAVVCALRKESCIDCILRRSCIYVNLFDPSFCTKGVPPPPPYVIEAEDCGDTCFKEGDKFSFNLLLFGKANDYLPYFVYAFNEIGQQGIGRRTNDTRGRFSLSTVESGNVKIYDSNCGKIDDWPEAEDYLPVFSKQESGVRRISISLLTPLRVKYANHLAVDLPFHLLIRTVLRRISTLYKTYGEGEPSLDYRGIIDRSKDVRIVQKNLSWFDWSRYSRRQDQRMFMGGLVGSVLYEGDLDEFLPYLRFCELVHLGKQTTFGLGKIKLEIIGV
ncbi:MAG: CRISPR system precrRNA processing endoribonuclease RAMP protein Cas6 [Syntrophales bacterium]|nr:CRISPR system precrRNA processing endoribonuclease RAMP protein Cas6 [Syntrophales bacterium]